MRLQTQSPHVDSLRFGGTKILLGGKTDWRQSKLVVQLVRGSRVQGSGFTVHGSRFTVSSLGEEDRLDAVQICRSTAVEGHRSEKIGGRLAFSFHFTHSVIQLVKV